MDGLDMLGARLDEQYITLRVKHIDQGRLISKLGSKGALVAGALKFADADGKATLDMAIPIAKKYAKDYGIELETMVTNAPPSPKGRALSEFWPGLAIGIGIGGASLAIVKLVGKLIGGRAAV